MPKILLIDTLHASFIEKMEAKGFECVEGYTFSRAEILERINEWEGVVIRSRFLIDAAFLHKASHLRFIARVGAGMENIDTVTAGQLNIACIHAPEGNRDAVGEQALGMLLMLLNNLHKADREVRKGIWKREENRGEELTGKTVGIIGFGNMGSAFARKLRGFDTPVLAYDKYITIDPLLYPWVKQCSMETLFEECDVVSLHVPLTDETRYLVNADFFLACKKAIYIINTARGKVLDTTALVAALESGKVIGAALDVLEYESLSFEALREDEWPEPLRYLAASDKVVLAPHIAGWTHQSNEKMATILCEKIFKLYNL